MWGRLMFENAPHGCMRRRQKICEAPAFQVESYTLASRQGTVIALLR
jgi:hypothetical protein